MNSYFRENKMKRRFFSTIGLIVIVSLGFSVSSCNRDNNEADAYGNFEAIETIISAESNGKLLYFGIDEGQSLTADSTIGMIDTMQLHYQKEQILSKKDVIQSKFANIIAQVNVVEEQITTLEKEKARVENLLKSGAATQKQLDDINGQINILNKQMLTIKTQNASIFAELESVESSIALIDDQISRAVIINPVKGIVLEKYVQQFEIVNAGKPLYKLADLSEIILRAYVSGDQLDDFKIGQKVNVYIDADKDSNHEYEGEIVWVSSEAEFTPKIIQTKKERVNLVYAVKIKVKNDGKIKIGMPGEVRI